MKVAMFSIHNNQLCFRVTKQFVQHKQRVLGLFTGKFVPQNKEKMEFTNRHYVLDSPLDGEFEGMEMAMFGMGCFWGAERKFWQVFFLSLPSCSLATPIFVCDCFCFFFL